MVIEIVKMMTDEKTYFQLTPKLRKFRRLKPRKLQPAMTCSKLTIETLEQGVKYLQT